MVASDGTAGSHALTVQQPISMVNMLMPRLTCKRKRRGAQYCGLGFSFLGFRAYFSDVMRPLLVAS